MPDRYLGKILPRLDAVDIVTGRTRYSRDYEAPGMLWVKTVRSPHPHARVVRIDTAGAEALPEVVRVATARDLAGHNGHGLPVPDWPVLIPEGGEACCAGDAIALVAAETEAAAEEGARLVRVDYEPLPVISDLKEAARPGGPHLRGDGMCGAYDYGRGDPAKGLAASDEVVDLTFRFPRQEHAYLEAEAGLAVPSPDGTITVYAGLQDPFWARREVARALGVREGTIRAVIPPMGGAFGGKQSVSVHIHVALIALLTGRPAKLAWTREESFAVHPKRHPGRERIRLGATRYGRLTALEADILYDAGAYTAQTIGVVYWAGLHAAGPYDIPSVRIQARGVFTNNPVSGAFRGFGAPQPILALECALDEMARRLELDPAELRRRNALREGSEAAAPGITLDSRVTLVDTIDAALKAAGPVPKNSSPSKRTGRGLASAMPMFDVSSEPVQDLKGTGAAVEMYRDGTIGIRSGVVEMGTGLTTLLRHIVAEEFDLGLDDVALTYGDSALVPKAGATVGSRGAYTSGNAVRLAALDLRERVMAKAAEMLKAEVSTLRLSGGRVYPKDEPERSLPLGEVADRAFFEGVDLVGRAWFVGHHAGAGHTFCSTVTDVEVDTETGAVKVLRMVCAHDAGRVLNPVNAKSQLEGGAIQAMGYTVMEEMPVEGGLILTPSLAEYYIPTSLDVPAEVIVVHVEDPYPTGPYGAKGLGEHAMMTQGPSVLNAIRDAVGVRLIEFPATPERVFLALKQSKAMGQPSREENPA